MGGEDEWLMKTTEASNHMQIATYYLETGRTVDIFLNADGSFKAQDADDADLSNEWGFGKRFPTWNDVSRRWLIFTGELGENDP